MSRRITLFFILTIISSLNLRAQDKSTDLSRITDNLTHYVQERLPDWNYISVTPIEGSREVSISQWTSGNKMVSVTIVGHSSQAEAVKRIREFATNMKATRQTPEAGEEEYAWSDSASIVFQKHNITVNVNVRGDDLKDEKKLSKQFARLVVNSISKQQ